MKLHEYTYVETKIQFEFKNFFFGKYFFLFKSNWLNNKKKSKLELQIGLSLCFTCFAQLRISIWSYRPH